MMEKELSLLRRSELGLEVSETVSSESSLELELLLDDEELMVELFVTVVLARETASLPEES